MVQGFESCSELDKHFTYFRFVQEADEDAEGFEISLLLFLWVTLWEFLM